MKIKILIFPLIIITILYLTIWFIIPSYSDIQKKEGKLNDLTDKVSVIDGEVSNAASLLASLNDNSEDQKLIIKYLPAKKQDEDIVAIISSLAATSGVVVAGLDFQSDDTVVNNAALSYDDLGNPIPQKADPLKTFKVSINIRGNYGNIRQFLFSLPSTNRYNEISMISIGRDSGASEGSDALSMKADLIFNYFERETSASAVNESFFSSGQFNLSVAQSIRKKATINVPPIDIGSMGRENLFAL